MKTTHIYKLMKNTGFSMHLFSQLESNSIIVSTFNNRILKLLTFNQLALKRSEIMLKIQLYFMLLHAAA